MYEPISLGEATLGADVFGDYPLARTVQKIEQEYRTDKSPDILPNLIEAIRTRYDFVDPLFVRKSNC